MPRLVRVLRREDGRWSAHESHEPPEDARTVPGRTTWRVRADGALVKSWHHRCDDPECLDYPCTILCEYHPEGVRVEIHQPGPRPGEAE